MIRRMQFNKSWLLRMPAVPTMQFEHEVTSKYKPHQGAKEMARRRKQLSKSQTFEYRA